MRSRRTKWAASRVAVTQDCVLTVRSRSRTRARGSKSCSALYWTGLHPPTAFLSRAPRAIREGGEIGYKVRQTWKGSGRVKAPSARVRRSLLQRSRSAASIRSTRLRTAARTVFGPMQDAYEEEPLE
jgi:hypothetical protein